MQVDFRISDTFTDSLARLTGNEQKALNTAAFDLQIDPVNPTIHFYRIHRCKDPNFWSIRARRDIRVIVHKLDASLLLCYVGHCDAAYAWAEWRRIKRHPRTGAAQLVELRETVRELQIAKYVEAEVVAAQESALPKPALLSRITADDLRGYGVSKQWIDDVLAVNEGTLFELANRLTREAAEAVLDLSTGVTSREPVQTSQDVDPLSHPDAISRFRIMSDVGSLRRAIDAPLDKWAVFLHPSQEASLKKAFKGPARVCGSAGTGMTIPASHRSFHSAKQILIRRVSEDRADQSLADASDDESGRLFYGGTPGQRFAQTSFSWKSLGVDIRDRSQTLKIKYRTSHQIRSQADRLLPGSISDVDENAESRGGTISVFNGPKPLVTACDSQEGECSTVAAWIAQRQTEGVRAGEVCVIVRRVGRLERANAAAAKAGIESVVPDSQTEPHPENASIATMHEAKELEFRAVIDMACDDEDVPLQSRIESATDTSELEEVYNTEGHLLNVACTRARDRLLATAVVPASEFLDDFDGATCL